jgi:16S rRNA (cytosine967-C5)-methyltransferase
MNNTGKVYSCDLHDNRVNLIRAGAQRLGLSCVIPMKNDAKLFSQDIPAADRVLCDVPCSGLGVIRRKPEIKYKGPREFQRLPQIQYDILKMSCKYVKVGGILVYSTCTLSRDENDRVVDRFLRENPDFESCPLGEIFGDDKNRTRITLTPGKYNSDGFFVAKLKRIR